MIVKHFFETESFHRLADHNVRAGDEYRCLARGALYCQTYTLPHAERRSNLDTTTIERHRDVARGASPIRFRGNGNDFADLGYKTTNHWFQFFVLHHPKDQHKIFEAKLS